MTTINVPLMLKLADTIVKHPEQFRAQEWDCGTTACFAGWLGRLAGTPWKMGVCSSLEIEAAAGLTRSQGTELFLAGDYTRCVWQCSDPVRRAELAVGVIHAFLDRHAPGWRDQAATLKGDPQL